MAEGLFRHMVADRTDIAVRSAGVGAGYGQPPSLFSVEVLRPLGLDISQLRSQPLTEELVDGATFIFAMTRGHLETIQMLFPEAAEKAFLVCEFDPDLARFTPDIPDPIGLGIDAYVQCRDTLLKALPSVLAAVDGFSPSAASAYGSPSHSPPPKPPTHTTPMETQYAPPATRQSALAQADPEVFKAIEAEEKRQFENIELIASENFTSRAVMEAQGSVFTNKYAEGYPGRRWYGGCENMDTVEQLAIDRAKRIFGADHANVQPHSGSQANMAVYFSVLQPGDRILTMDLNHGGHLTHGNKANFSGRFYEVSHYGVNRETELIDYDDLARHAEQFKPRMITAGASAYPRIIDFDKMAAIAQSVGAYLFVDMAHVAGLVAGGVHPSPVPMADFVTTTTHKSLRGPRGGIILCKDKYATKIDGQVFPGIQGGPLMHVIAAKAVCFHEALQPGFHDYQRQIILNAKALSARMTKNGYRIVSGGTDNHLMLVDLRPQNITGKEAQETLDRAGITVNKNGIPFDTVPITKGGGIRIGTPAVTTRGMKEEEMMEVADLIDAALKAGNDEARLHGIRKQVRELMQGHPLPK